MALAPLSALVPNQSQGPLAARPLLSLLLAAVLLPSAALASAPDPRRIGWSELRFEASKLGLSLESRLELRRMTAAEIRQRLIDPGTGEWLPAPSAGGWLLQLETEGLGKHSRLDLMLDSRGGALQRTQLETGRRHKDHRNRVLRFARDGVHVDSRKPTKREVDAPSEEWSNCSDWLLELPPLGADAVLGQATGLFFTLGAADLAEPGDRVTTYVLSKGRVMAVDLVVEARETIEVDLVEVDNGRSRRRNGELETLRVRVGGRGVEPQTRDTDFRFLGMRGDVRVFLDVATRAPVLIIGRVGWLGRAKVRLRTLVLGRH